MGKRSSRQDKITPARKAKGAQTPPIAIEEPKSPPSWFRSHAYIVAVIAGCAILFTWMVTVGTWRLFDTETFTAFYDVQAQSLLHGHWDVPQDTLRFESFIRDGKYYGYFGFVPALMRIPLMLAAPSSVSMWNRSSMLIGYVVTLAIAYALLLRLRPDSARPMKVVYGGFILSLGLGSTLFFLGSRSFTYHEALMWAAAFALGSYYQLVRYLLQPRWITLIAASVLAFLAYFTRPSVGAGPVLALALLGANIAAARWLLPPNRRLGRTGLIRAGRAIVSPFAWLNRWGDAPPSYRHAMGALGAVLVVVLVFVSVNYAKFRTYFEAAPLHMYAEVIVNNPHRLDGTNGKVLRAVNIRTGMYEYLAPWNVFTRPYFPWVMLNPPQAVQPFPEAKYSSIEPHASITAMSPALVCLALLGLTAMRRRIGAGTTSSATIPLLAALAGGTLMFAADGLTHRYLHDLFPFIALAGALGINVILGWQASALRRAAWAALIPLGVWGVLVNFSSTLMYQRVLVWGVPKDRQLQYLQWSESINEHISRPLFGPPG